jgi:glycosyltransferase involved in cell wall biosynthesis
VRLLLITPKVDPADDLFGHVNTWAAALARRVDRVYVVALWPGHPDLPSNARFATLGKASAEGGSGSVIDRARWLGRLQRIVARLCLRGEVDAVLAHMGPVFAVAAAPIARLAGLPTFLWYAHGHVSPMLRLAHSLVDGVGTSTPEGFRIASPKVTITGQGIDLERFRPAETTPVGKRLLSVGRFSPIKDYETLLDALARPGLRDRADLRVRLLGGVHSETEQSYLDGLRQRVRRLGIDSRVCFETGLPHAAMAQAYQGATLFASTSRTGSLDKAVLEAAACGLAPVVCNPAFQNLYGDHWPALSFAAGDAGGLAERLADWLDRPSDARRTVTSELRAEIARSHSVDHWADAVVGMLSRRVDAR